MKDNWFTQYSIFTLRGNLLTLLFVCDRELLSAVLGASVVSLLEDVFDALSEFKLE